jgi:RNA polymerase sigma factor (sigma-70 family)
MTTPPLAHEMPSPVFGVTDALLREMAATLHARFRTRRAVSLDVCNDAVAHAVLRAIETNPCVDSLSAWLYRVASNKLHEGIRRPCSVLNHERPDQQQSRVSWGDVFRDAPMPEPLREMERADELAALRHHLGRINKRQRRVLWLHHVQGVPYSEIGARLGTPEIRTDHLRMIASNGRTALRARMLRDPRINPLARAPL